MKRLGVLIICLGAALSALADTVYLKQGAVYAGTVTYWDDAILRIELSDGQLKEFQVTEVFRVIDESGSLLFDGSQEQKLSETPEPDYTTINPVPEPDPLANFSTTEYEKVIKFPMWPFLGGTAILGYFGISQLSKSADTYDESKELEALGLEFSDTRDRSQKQRNWGQICIAGAVACLITGLTPQYEKVPVQTEITIKPTDRGITLSINF